MVHTMGDQKCNSLYDRVNKLLVSYEWSDCSFSVSGKKFKAHKLILGISSPVFEAMFYGPLSSNEDISITDIEPEIFQLLLTYIYTDKVDVSSIDEAFELMYVSRKYLLDHLTEICVNYIQDNMTVDNVITIINYPEYMQDNNLVAAAFKLLFEHANHVLVAHLNTITLQCMKKILQCGSLNISEKNLIKCVFKWTEYQCKQNNLYASQRNRRSILVDNGIFKLLRFDVLSSEELTDVVTDEDNLLLLSESDKIGQYIKDGDCMKTIDLDLFTFTDEPRNTIKLQWELCHRSPLRSMSPATIDNYSNILQTRLRANKSVFINSLSVPSRMAPVVHYYNNTSNAYWEQFNVTVISESECSMKKDMTLTKAVEYDSNINVLFLQPLFMKKDQWYKIMFTWPKQNTHYSYSYALQSRECSYNNSKIEFKFQDSGKSGGSFLKGLTFSL